MGHSLFGRIPTKSVRGFLEHENKEGNRIHTKKLLMKS